jgi:hypothetical protein
MACNMHKLDEAPGAFQSVEARRTLGIKVRNCNSSRISTLALLLSTPNVHACSNNADGN